MTTYTAQQWRDAFDNLKSTAWQDDDAEGDLEMTLVDAYRSENGDYDELMVSAIIQACAKTWTAWEPVDLYKMAKTFTSYFDSWETALAGHLYKNYNDLHVDNIKDGAPVWGEIFTESELLVEPDTGGLYVFTKPGTASWEHATKDVTLPERETGDNMCDDGCGKHIDHKGECGLR